MNISFKESKSASGEAWGQGLACRRSTKQNSDTASGVEHPEGLRRAWGPYLEEKEVLGAESST